MPPQWTVAVSFILFSTFCFQTPLIISLGKLLIVFYFYLLWSLSVLINSYEDTSVGFWLLFLGNTCWIGVAWVANDIAWHTVWNYKGILNFLQPELQIKVLQTSKILPRCKKKSQGRPIYAQTQRLHELFFRFLKLLTQCNQTTLRGSMLAFVKMMGIRHLQHDSGSNPYIGRYATRLHGLHLDGNTCFSVGLVWPKTGHLTPVCRPMQLK